MGLWLLLPGPAQAAPPAQDAADEAATSDATTPPDDPFDGLAWPEPAHNTPPLPPTELDGVDWPEPAYVAPPPVEIVEPAPPPPPRPAGPRADRLPGAGVSAGFDGLLAAVVSYMWDEMVAIDVSVGILFPTLDVRVRYFGLREMVSPVFGIGMTVPFERDARFGLDVPEYADLYRLGESFHVDIGLGVAPDPHVEIFAGVALVTTIDQDTLDRLILFPQVAAQVVAYF